MVSPVGVTGRCYRAGTPRTVASGIGGKLQAWMSVVTEIGARALLVIGLLTPLACAAVISVMLIASMLATFWRPQPKKTEAPDKRVTG
jgi:uncharacterized membrane protein YphA (DoxX/SURF4 family)